MGLVPMEVEQGDSVFILLGGKVLYVLRNIDASRYNLIGEAYFHGMMDGEGMRMLERGEASLQDVILE